VAKIRPNQIFDRDQWTCQLCGQTFTEGQLVPHHRANRGMGGNPQADTPGNIASLCGLCNGLIESDAVAAAKARHYGIKISRFDADRAHEIPMYGFIDGQREWLFILNNYSRKAVNEHTQLLFMDGEG
jgi:hypothetical protein